MLKKLLTISLFLLGLITSHYSYSMEKRGVKRKEETEIANDRAEKKSKFQQNSLLQCTQKKSDGSPCNKTFTLFRKLDYIDHVNAHRFAAGTIDAPYYCGLCGYGTAKSSNLYRHLYKEHPDDLRIGDQKMSTSEIRERYVGENSPSCIPLHIVSLPAQTLSDNDNDNEEDREGKEDSEASDSGETTESCYYEDEGDGDEGDNESDKAESISYEEEEEEESSDSGDHVISPRSNILKTYTIASCGRRKYTKRDSAKLWICEKNKPDGTPCGKKYKKHSSFFRHSNAPTIHQNAVLGFGYICSLCHEYKNAASSNIYRHIRRDHSGHENDTLNQLQQYTGILSLRESATPVPALQKEGRFKCTHDGCGRAYQSQSGLWKHRQSKHKAIPQSIQEPLQEDRTASQASLADLLTAIEHDESSSGSFCASPEPEQEEEEEEEIVENSGVISWWAEQRQAAVALSENFSVPAAEQEQGQDGASGSGNIPEPCREQEGEEEEESSDSGEPIPSPRTQIRKKYDIGPLGRQKYTKRNSGKLWICEKNKPDGTPCGKKYKKHSSFVRHINAATKHQNGTLNYGHICTICHNYTAALSSNVYKHIKMWHPGHENDTPSQLKQYVGILTSRESTAPTPALQKEGRFKCPHEGCGRAYQDSGGLKYHLVKNPEHRQ